MSKKTLRRWRKQVTNNARRLSHVDPSADIKSVYCRDVDERATPADMESARNRLAARYKIK